MTAFDICRRLFNKRKLIRHNIPAVMYFLLKTLSLSTLTRLLHVIHVSSRVKSVTESVYKVVVFHPLTQRHNSRFVNLNRFYTRFDLMKLIFS
jgi:hypothetical protein